MNYVHQGNQMIMTSKDSCQPNGPGSRPCGLTHIVMSFDAHKFDAVRCKQRLLCVDISKFGSLRIALRGSLVEDGLAGTILHYIQYMSVRSSVSF